MDALVAPHREAGRERWRWTRPDSWHLTTVFMASVGDDARRLLIENLSGVAGRHESFEVGIGGASCFPHPERARTLTLGVNGGHDQLDAVAMSCRAAASLAGADPAGGEFVGHLTLARARRPFDATGWTQAIDSLPGWKWWARELVLVQSNLMDPANRFEVLERFTLAYA